MGKTFTVGDIHGAHKALMQCLERSNFDYDEDVLISLGDICDGWDEVSQCLDELCNIRYLVAIKGNHDEPFAEFLKLGIHPWSWKQGGEGTAKSYLKLIGKEHLFTPKPRIHFSEEPGFLCALNPADVPELHKRFFEEQVPYYIDDKKRLFIHGGFNRHFPLKEQQPYIFWWDRDLWSQALSYEAMDRGEINKNVKFKTKDNFSEIFIGHTTTINWKKDTPMKAANIWNIDTGAGFYGKLTIMNVDTKEYFQSDLVRDLYPNQKGRQ